MKRLFGTNLSLQNNLPTFRLNGQVVIGVKVKRCKQTLLFIVMHYWRYTLLEVKGRWGLLLPPCHLITVINKPGTFSPPFRLKLSFEGVLWMCRTSFTILDCFLNTVGFSWSKASFVRIRNFERRGKGVCEVRRIELGLKCISGWKWRSFMLCMCY